METEISLMVGRTPVRIEEGEDYIHFHFSDGSKGVFDHRQDCCEHVYVDDVSGDWSDLIGTPILVADERTGDFDAGPDHHFESVTWTFYTFRGVRGSVDVRWCGSSNGYYSERVDFTFRPAP